MLPEATPEHPTQAGSDSPSASAPARRLLAKNYAATSIAQKIGTRLLFAGNLTAPARLRKHRIPPVGDLPTPTTS